MDELEEKEVVLVVGRATDPGEWLTIVKANLYDNFTIVSYQPVEEEIGIDGKVRWIAFVTNDGVGASSAAQVIRLRGEGFGAYDFSSMEEAVDYAKLTYEFGTEQEAAAQHMAEIAERFQPFTAEESEAYSIFDALYHVGRTRLVRGLYGEDEIPVVVVCHMAAGGDMTEVRVTPLAMLITPAFIDDIELPFSPSEEE